MPASLAEVLRAYSNFRIPPVETLLDNAHDGAATLVQQSEGLSVQSPAFDEEPARVGWKSTRPHHAEVVRLYEDGRSLTSIAKEVGIHWDSVARLLDRAGVRERRRKE